VKGDTCKHENCNNKVTATYGKLCNQCHNYPEKRKHTSTKELYDKFLGLTPKRKRA